MCKYTDFFYISQLSARKLRLPDVDLAHLAVLSDDDVDAWLGLVDEHAHQRVDAGGPFDRGAERGVADGVGLGVAIFMFL